LNFIFVVRTEGYAPHGGERVGPDCGLIATAQLPAAGDTGAAQRQATYSNAELIFVVETSSHGLTDIIDKINDTWRQGHGGVLQEAWAINVGQKRIKIWSAALRAANPATDGWGPAMGFYSAHVINPGVAPMNTFAFNFRQLRLNINRNFS